MTEYLAPPKWAVLSTYRDDHSLTYETHLAVIAADEADARKRANTLQAEQGFEKSDGGDGIESRFFTVRQVHLAGQRATKEVVEVVTSTYVIDAVEGDSDSLTDKELVVSSQEKTALNPEYMWDFFSPDGKNITLRKNADGSMYMDEYSHRDTDQANWGTLLRDRYHIAPKTGQILSKEPTDWEDYWKGDA